MSVSQIEGAHTASPVAFAVADLGANNPAAMQAAITAALADMFVRLGNVGGSVVPSTGAAWPAIEPDAWYAALEAIPGLTASRSLRPAPRSRRGWAPCSLSAP